MLSNDFFPPVKTELVRMGRNNDGGYLVATESIAQTHYLFSFGLAHDCSFEADFDRRGSLTIAAYDHTTDSDLWYRSVWHDAWKVLLLRKSFGKFRRGPYAEYRMYKRLFTRDHAHHYQKMIGLPPEGTDVLQIYEQHGSPQNIFFKIDIEGAEYAILDQLIAIQDSITGLVIEFHDCNENRATILEFVRNFALVLVHIHGNNFSSLDADGNPEVLEMTFKRPSVHDSPNPPHTRYPLAGLDQPNAWEKADHVLSFAVEAS